MKISKYTGAACSICGLPTISAYTRICEECLNNKPPFERIQYYGIYDGTLKESIHLFKFNGIKRLAAPLSKLLYTIVESNYDAIVPVPLHPKKLRDREFNQTALLGLHLAKRLDKPLMTGILSKTRDTNLQTDVSGQERRKNLKGAFSATDTATGMRVLLIDDVITTGATIKECAITLRKAGAASVNAVALARSMPR